MLRSDVDKHQIGPVTGWTVRVARLKAAEAALQNLAHHCKIIARSRFRPLDVELAIGVLDEAFRPGDDHCAKRVRALYMAVVVHLDAAGRGLKLEQIGQFAPYPPLQNGKASCRERVCQSVSIWVVAVSIK